MRDDTVKIDIQDDKRLDADTLDRLAQTINYYGALIPKPNYSNEVVANNVNYIADLLKSA